MAPSFELLRGMIAFRVDAAALLAGALGGCFIYHRILVRRRVRQEFAVSTCLLMIAIVLVGALLAEVVQRWSGESVSESIASIAVARASVLSMAALSCAVTLLSALRLAQIRAEIRLHADAGRELQSAKSAADEASRAKSEFLAMMSHEIRTPLNAVMGFANLLAESPLDEAQRGYVNTITTEGARLGSLLNDILDLTKIEKGRLILERLPFAPVESVQEVLRLLAPKAADRMLDLRFEAQVAGQLLVAGDPLRFRQVIVNLVDNAIKFTPRGSVTLFMAWEPPAGSQSSGRLAIRVRDTGIGIPSEKLKDLFQMFMQADSSTTRRYGGTGLGLAICQRLVMLMGGEITVHSTLNEGSEFSFTIPLAPLPLPGEPAAPKSDQPMKFTRPPRILVVDDMETNRFLLEVFLRRNGFEPQLAAGGEEAIRLAMANRYDAILMDLQMPDIDGYTATQRIRDSEPPGQHTPIIALTASLAKGTREKCLAAGMDEHLTKPLDLPKFRTILSSYVGSPADPARVSIEHATRSH